MIYVVFCKDKPDSQALRRQTREEHLAYLQQLGAVVQFAGPFVGETGQVEGSMIGLDVNSFAEAENIARADPYAKEGLFQTVEIRQWNCVINNLRA